MLTMEEKIKVLLVDGHASVRDGLRAVITTEPDLVVVGEAADWQTAVKQVHEMRPDVAVVDPMVAGSGDQEAIRAIRQAKPGIRILILTNLAGSKQVLEALRAGVQGYILKGSPAADVIQAIRDVFHGKPALDPSVLDTLVQKPDSKQSRSRMPPV